MRDTWSDGAELFIQVTIGNSDLVVSGFYYRENDCLESSIPKEKELLRKNSYSADCLYKTS